MEALKAFGREISKDKYLLMVLIVILLVVFVRTSNAALEQLLVTSVGAFIGLMRGTQSNQHPAGDGK